MENAAAILDRDRSLMREVPAALHHTPAILLCPERIQEIYPTVLRVAGELRHPIPLSANPALVNLRMTSLHELGHHFFPAHRAGRKRFICEALANLFCYAGLEPEVLPWLLYKTWHLQPPEYSAYRPLRLLCERNVEFRAAVGACFEGDVRGWGWASPNGFDSFEHGLGSSLNMAVAFDAAACVGLQADLRHLLSTDERWFPCVGDGLLCHFMRGATAGVPADFVGDLYAQNDLAYWATVPGFPSRVWGRWAHGDKVRWPHDAVKIPSSDVEKWLLWYASTAETPLASVIGEKLVDLIRRSPTPYNSSALKQSLDRALAVACDAKAAWFDRVPAIQFIEACADLGIISRFQPKSEAMWRLAHFTVELQSIAENYKWGDVHDAARKAVAALRNRRRAS